MKILQVTNKMPYPPIDGGAIATLNMSKGFVSNSAEVTVFAMNTKKHFFDPDKIEPKLKKTIKFETVSVPAEISGKGALKNLLLSKLPYNAERFIDDNFKKKLIQILKEKDFDIVQFEGLYLMPYVDVVKQYSKAKVSLRSHNVEYEIWDRVAKNEKNPIKKKYLKILSKRIKKFEISYINKYDLLVTITKRDLDIYNKLGNTKPSFVSMTGINVEELNTDKIETQYPSVFHLGALDWAPNQEGIIWFLRNVWKKLIKKHSNLKFYIAGRNAPRWFVEETKKYNNVIFLGEVADAYSFMKSKAIMIVPLFSGSGMRIKIIEGMALGKTIVSTSIGTEGIDTTHTKNIILANNSEEFYSEIDFLIVNKEKYKQIGENARKFIIENFDNKVIIRKLLKFYEEYINL